MAYVQPDAATFKARYPEFAPVSDALITLVLQESFDDVGDTWYERDRARAQMLLTAHKLVGEGEPGRTASGSGVGLSGPVASLQVGDVITKWAGTGGGSGSGGSAASGYMTTIYGQEFYALLRKNFPAVAAV